ncbi:MAG: hypothetical protein HY505_01015 [Candidatus Yanofskybacteria bacterium]|nr:hypothetical protein [Candidatus Yanofskybacteria bacterium]
MSSKEYGKQVIKRNLCWVVFNLNNLGVAGLPAGDAFICWVRSSPAGIAGHHGNNALEHLKYGFGAPKASSAENYYFFVIRHLFPKSGPGEPADEYDGHPAEPYRRMPVTDDEVPAIERP